MTEKVRLARKLEGALDFKKGLLKPMEDQFGAIITSIEELPHQGLVDQLDFAGVDAFFKRKRDKPDKVYGISSRVNWAWFGNKPHFSFRFAYWNKQLEDWRPRQEYARKLAISQSTEKPIYPELHVESFSEEKASGKIRWAFMARTADVVTYLHSNYERDGKYFSTKNGVIIKETKNEERRLIIAVPVDVIANVCKVDQIKLK